jgi:tetratricopeptide (TPR) repeat protein
VHDLGIDPNGQPFYTMKLIAGITLKKVLELLKERQTETIAKYSLPALLTIFQKVCDGLAFAHSRGVIHRDLKPANIMIGKFGEVLVMDWGLAKVIGRARSQEEPSQAIGEVTVDSARREEADEFSTLGGSVMGTPHYMSPEQARGEIESLDQRSDVFSLGVMLFEMLTLERPFQGQTAAHIIANICAGQFVPASQLVSMQARGGSGKVPRVLPHLPAGRVPKSLDAIVLKAMSLDRHARYGSVKELQADLNAYQTGFATQAEGTNAWKQIRLLVKRNLPASIGIAAVLVVSAILGTGAIVQGKRAKEALIALKKTAPALRRLADTEASLQQFDSALENLDAAIDLDPGYLPSYWRRAWLLIGKEDYAASAAAIRIARARDESHPEWANILSVVEALANAPNESRWTPERAESVYRHLTSVNAAGETSALSASMRLASREKAELVINRLQQWFGAGKIEVTVSRSGLIAVRARGEVVQSLAPFHGLSINSLDLAGSPAPDLEPLRGMPLVHLILGTKVQSLEPLRGMQLKELDASGAALTDVSALQGMPLEKLLLVGASLQNLSFLSGAPLRELGIERCGVTDLSPLRGAPLVSLGVGQNPIVDLQPLSQAPLESLDISNTAVADLRPLRGLPLKRLIASRSKITDLSALQGARLITLDVSHCPIQDYSPLLSNASLEKLVVSGRSSGIEVLRNHPALRQIQLKNDGETVQPLVPVTEFWTRYDAQKAALK